MSQEIVTVEARDFGLKADGKTDNTDAFKKLAEYINNRKGNVLVKFEKGVHLAGKQDKKTLRDNFYLSSPDVFELRGVSNVSIIGQEGTIFRYNEGLFYGSFNTKNMSPLTIEKDFYNPQQGCAVGNFLSISDGNNILVEAINLEGNAENSIGGDVYGDVGIQIYYTGIYIRDCRNVIIRGVHSSNFGLDGSIINNKKNSREVSDNIKLIDCRFFLNGRQGLSWVSGNHLEASNCRFELSGRGKYSSAPGAGLDIEAEEGPIRNGRFINCIFSDNAGCALVSETGDVADCRFDSCSFIGITTWSVWVRQPGFSFFDCTLWGSGVHGYSASDDKQATTFVRCRFTDEPYENRKTFGNYLFESNGVKRLTFDSCRFEAMERKALWLDGLSPMNPRDYYRLWNNTIIISSSLQINDFSAVLRRVDINNNTWMLSRQVVNNRNLIIGVDASSEVNRINKNKKVEIRQH
jgi:hypothetical protein